MIKVIQRSRLQIQRVLQRHHVASLKRLIRQQILPVLRLKAQLFDRIGAIHVSSRLHRAYPRRVRKRLIQHRALVLAVFILVPIQPHQILHRQRLTAHGVLLMFHHVRHRVRDVHHRPIRRAHRVFKRQKRDGAAVKRQSSKRRVRAAISPSAALRRPLARGDVPSVLLRRLVPSHRRRVAFSRARPLAAAALVDGDDDDARIARREPRWWGSARASACR